MNISLRERLVPTDRDAIRTITASSGFFSELEITTAVQVCDDALNNPVTDYRFVVAEDAAHLLGYACWGKDTLTDASYELYWIAVDDGERAHGIGGLLLEAVERAISAINPGAQLFIETAGREQYLPTRIFYQRHGYHQVAWLTDYYASGDAKVIYAKKLTGPCTAAPA